MFKREKKIQDYMTELRRNDEMLKKNKEEHRMQVQIGLHKKGLPPGSPMFDTLLEKMKMDIEVEQIKVDLGFKCINPVFEFQRSKRLAEIQMEMSQKHVKAMKGNVAEIEKNLEEVKNDIIAQNERMKDRRVQILEELEKLGEDVSELKKEVPDYIN